MSLRRSKEMESVRQVRTSLSLVRQRLLNPTAKALESCTPHLRAAIDSLAGLQGQLQKGAWRTAPELRAEVAALRMELAQAKALMKNAYAFHAALAHLLTPQPDDSVDYGTSGIVANRPAVTIRVEG